MTRGIIINPRHVSQTINMQPRPIVIQEPPPSYINESNAVYINESNDVNYESEDDIPLIYLTTRQVPIESVSARSSLSTPVLPTYRQVIKEKKQEKKGKYMIYTFKIIIGLILTSLVGLMVYNNLNIKI